MPDAYCLYKVFAHVPECVAKVYTLARTLACPIAVYNVAVGQGLRPCPLSPACLRQVRKIHIRTIHFRLVYHRK